LALGLLTLGLILFIRKVKHHWPGQLISLAVASLILFLFQLDEAGVRVLGELPSGLPPIAPLPLFNHTLIAELATSALAVAAIGIIQTMAVARTFAALTGERVDSNQEFVGQGLANVAAGFFSGLPVSGSFSRSAVNFQAGARSALAPLLSGVLILLAMLTLAPLGAYLPRAAIASVLLIVAYGMINRAEMARLWRGARGDAVIMFVTFFGTLFLPIHFAVLTGILMSLAYYILQTSAPRVYEVLPDDEYRHLVYRPQKPSCPQLGIIDILGDLYFGAVHHVEEAIHRYRREHPTQRFLLLRMRSVHHCDISGINMLASILRAYRKGGGDLFLTQVRQPVLVTMKATGFYHALGSGNFLPEDDAIEYLFYHVLDPAVCIYESDVRVFRECQNLPRPDYPVQIILPTDIAVNGTARIAAQELWRALHSAQPPLVVDMREPREWKRGHIPQAQLRPLSHLFEDQKITEEEIPRDRPVVLVDRSGRRSARIAALLHKQGYNNMSMLDGGMLAWRAAGLLEAVEERET
ncbi:MAG: SulP family inorganic anion transporter, partial [Ardenticatenaceae bacterium]